eukprot:2369829-Alexandrium_andersonii.AAC.1
MCIRDRPLTASAEAQHAQGVAKDPRPPVFPGQGPQEAESQGSPGCLSLQRARPGREGSDGAARIAEHGVRAYGPGDGRCPAVTAWGR